MYTYFQKITQAGTWRDRVASIREAKRAFESQRGQMLPDERQRFKMALDNLTAESYGVVLDGAKLELGLAKKRFQQAQDALTAAKQAEIGRWDSQRLAAELLLAEKRLELALKTVPGFTASPLERVQSLIDEARTSGDPHKQRAICEAALTLEGQDFAFIRAEAARTLQTLRTTPELEAAAAAVNTSAVDLWRLRQELADAAGELFNEYPGGAFPNTAPLAKLLSTVRMLPDGTIEVLPEDATIGIDWSKVDPDNIPPFDE